MHADRECFSEYQRELSRLEANGLAIPRVFSLSCSPKTDIDVLAQDEPAASRIDYKTIHKY